MLSRYGKVYALGHRATAGILEDPCYIEEKVDGSQFGFGVKDGELWCRSKRANQDLDQPQKLFRGAVETANVLFNEGKLVEGWEYRGEAIESLRHNVLTYARVPDGRFVLFDVDQGDQDFVDRTTLEQIAEDLELEVVPALYGGRVTKEVVDDCLARESFLGGPKVEGVVIKRMSGSENMYGMDGKRVVAKVVSEVFKEKHLGSNKKPKGVSLIDKIAETYATEARWQKAIQSKREDGTLDSSPRDIGDLIKRIHADVLEEEGEMIEAMLWKHHVRAIRSALIRGFPQWYKEQLAEGAYDE